MCQTSTGASDPACTPEQREGGHQDPAHLPGPEDAVGGPDGATTRDDGSATAAARPDEANYNRQVRPTTSFGSPTTTRRNGALLTTSKLVSTVNCQKGRTALVRERPRGRAEGAGDERSPGCQERDRFLSDGAATSARPITLPVLPTGKPLPPGRPVRGDDQGEGDADYSIGYDLNANERRRHKRTEYDGRGRVARRSPPTRRSGRSPPRRRVLQQAGARGAGRRSSPRSPPTSSAARLPWIDESAVTHQLRRVEARRADRPTDRLTFPREGSGHRSGTPRAGTGSWKKAEAVSIHRLRWWWTHAAERPELRLKTIFERVQALLAAHAPSAVALEESFVGADARIALSVGQARGAVPYAAACGRRRVR